MEFEFYSASDTKRPIRLCDSTRKFAYESLNHKYGKDTRKNPAVSLDLDNIKNIDSFSDLEKYNAGILVIAKNAPLRVCPNELSQTMIKILQTAPCLATDSIDKRYYAIEEMLSYRYNVNVLCEVLRILKGTYYNRKLRGKNGNTQAKQRRDEFKPVIEAIYQESNQIYGPGKIAQLCMTEVIIFPQTLLHE